LPSSLPFGKAGDLQTLRCKGLAVVHYSVTLSASSLKTSDLYNVRVTTTALLLFESRVIPQMYSAAARNMRLNA
jgi:hypothetical protein